MRLKRVTGLSVASLFALLSAGCSGSADDDSLSSAFCSDLKSGASLFQLYSVVNDEYSLEQFADYAYGWSAISCPEELRSNAALRDFLDSWGINPDA